MVRRKGTPYILIIFVGYLLFSLLLSQGAKAGRSRADIDALARYLQSRDTLNIRDSLAVDSLVVDSLVVDSLPTDSLSTDSTLLSQLKAPLDFESQDSIVILPKRNLLRMYGNGQVKYESQQLQGDFMQMQIDSGNIYSTYIDYPDSLNRERIYAKITNEQETYEAKSINYNINTQQGYITDVVTQQGDGFVTADRTKRIGNGTLNLMDGKYTTCDNHEHPHFYISLTKAKVRPGKDLVSGPLYLVIADVPLPIGLPFAFFPFTTSRSSGLIMPTYGDEMDRGFYLRNGGYYFAINDYVDLQLTGDIYTKGSWGVQAQSTYRKRYRYSGSINASYIVTKRGDKIAGDYSKSSDFRIQWSHQQDAKANPYRSFSANVNFSTSSYNHNNLDGLYNQAVLGENTKSSSISFNQRFPNSPWSISGSMDINQRSRDKMLSVTLPNLSITMSRIYPFKRKQQVGKERWYEKISLSYSGQLRNSVQSKEDEFFKKNLIRDWQNGMSHSIPVSASFDLFNYIKVTPSLNYTERWYSSRVAHAYDPALNKVVPTDTTYGFNRVFDFSASLALSTTVYGFWKPLPFLGDKVDMIRHRMEPSISINYRPDFGDPRWGYWEHLRYITPDGRKEERFVSPYEGQLFGVPGRGKSGSIGLSLANNLEAKIKKDSTEFKKISLIESLNLSTSYNLAADSFQWSDLSASISLRLSQSFTLRLGGAFDLYLWDYHEHDGRIIPYRVDKLRVLNGKGIGHFKGTSTSFSYTFNRETIKKITNLFSKKKAENDGDDDGSSNDPPDQPPTSPRGEEGGGSLMGGKSGSQEEFDYNGYLKNRMDWSLSFNYNLSLGTGEFIPAKKEFGYQWRHDLSFSGQFSPTRNWRFNFSANYNFDEKRITNMTCNVTRDLHCWSMSASFIPIGPFKSYNFTIGVNSQLLHDLRYRKSSQPNYRATSQWY